MGQSEMWGQPTNWEPRTPAQRARDKGNAMNYRKKPVVIQAVQWTGANVDDVAALAGDAWPGEVAPNPPADSLVIATLEGEMRCEVGDWLIRGVKGEFYPCKPDIFEATYEPA